MSFRGGQRAQGPAADSAHIHRGSDAALELPVTDDLSGLRRAVRRSQVLDRLPQERRPDLVLAISEAAANALQYDQAPRSLRLWQSARAVVAEVSGQGRIEDPQAGHRRPSAQAVRGWGLWLIHELCDLVEVRHDEEKVRLRMHMRCR